MDVSGWKVIGIGAIRHAPWNYKQTGEKADVAKAKVKAAIRKRGQIVNVIVRPLGDGIYEMVNGNHRLDAFIEEGIKECMTFDLGECSQETAEMIALETNELNIPADDLKLGALLKHVAAVTPVAEMAVTLPYGSAQIESYIKAVDFSWDQYKKNEDDDKDDDTEPGPSRQSLVALKLPADIAEAFKVQLKRWPSDADAIRLCVDFLNGLR